MKKMNMRKGVVVPLLLGSLALTSLFVVGGSRVDESVHKNIYFKSKNLTDKTALAVANYYMEGLPKDQAQDKAMLIASKNPVYGSDLSSDLQFSWEDEKVTVTLPESQKDTFWLKALGVDKLYMPEVASSAYIADESSEETTTCNTTMLKPVAVNDQPFTVGQNLLVEFALTPNWDFTHKDKFYGLDLYATDDNYQGSDHVILYRNELGKSEADFIAEGCLQDECISDMAFDISGDKIIPQEDYKADIKVLGSALTYGSGGYDLMVTAKVKIGDTWFNADTFNTPVDGNFNDHQIHDLNITDSFSATDEIAVVAKSWIYDGWGDMESDSNWDPYMTVDGNAGSNNAIVLRDGDAVPEYDPFAQQTPLESYLEGYIDPDTGLVSLAQNQVIYLFELGTTNEYSEAYDFQDLVLLVSLNDAVPQDCPALATLLGAYLGTYTSNSAVDIGNTIDGFEDFTGYKNGIAPGDYTAKSMSIAILDDSQFIIGFVNVAINDIQYYWKGDPEYRWITLDTTVLAIPNKARLAGR